MRRVSVGTIGLAAAALTLAVRAQQEGDVVERVKISSDPDYPKFLSVREPKDETAPRSPRKSFKKSSKR